MNTPWKVYDYVDPHGRNIIKDQSIGYQKAERVKITKKLDSLELYGPNLGPKLLTPTKSKHIQEVVINGEVAVRILLCRGPVNVQSEHTILFIAEERDNKYEPRKALEIAEGHRGNVIRDPDKHRCDHERIKKDTY